MSLTNTLEGAMDLTIYTVLKGEHHEVSALFAALETPLKALEGGREAAFKKLKKELLSHSKAEEATVYDRLQSKLTDEELIEDSREEHNEIAEYLESIEGLAIDSDEWRTEVQALKTLVEHHVEEEEHETFDHMQRVFSEDEAKEMAKAFNDRKKIELESIKD